MNRNYGIDLAKWFSMLMVVVLHNLLNGGVLSRSTLSFNNLAYWWLENIAIVGVNIFALISGYLIVNRPVKLRRLVRLWYIVLFWSVVTTGIVMILTKHWVTISFIKSFFPVILGRYWYFNAYIALCLLLPFINAGIKELTQKQLERIIIALLFFAMTSGMLGHFFVQDGYSALWLVVMYLIGAYSKITAFDVKRISNRQLTVICIVMTLISLLGEIVSIEFIGHSDVWLVYNSPMVVIESVAIFMLFTRVEVRNVRLQKYLTRFTPLTFSVYLIDSNHAFYGFVTHSAFSFIRNQNIIIGYAIMIMASVGMFAVFMLCEYWRTRLFRKCAQLKLVLICREIVGYHVAKVVTNLVKD